MAKRYIGCSIKQLPDDELQAAAEFACSLNPANGPAVSTLAKLNMQPDKFAIAVMTSKFWGAAGVNHTVGFMGQVSAAVQDRILRYMNLWSVHCNAKFTITGAAASNADCRISLGAGGYYSYLGTDNARIPRSQNTMNLQAIGMATSDAECMRVIPHEVGHHLGCPHEHMRRTIIARLNVQKTIAKFMREQGWSETQVRQQIFIPVEEFSLMPGGSPTPDEDSAMCYGFSGDITIDGEPIIGGTRITVNDGIYMGKIYPLVGPPPDVSLTPHAIRLSGAIPAGSGTLTINGVSVDAFLSSPKAAGDYLIAHLDQLPPG